MEAEAFSYWETVSIEFFRSIPILIIGLITGYIAWRQYKIEQRKFKKEIYEKQLEFYLAYKQVRNRISNLLDLEEQPDEDFSYMDIIEPFQVLPAVRVVFSSKVEELSEDFRKILVEEVEKSIMRKKILGMNTIQSLIKSCSKVQSAMSDEMTL